MGQRSYRKRNILRCETSQDLRETIGSETGPTGSAKAESASSALGDNFAPKERIGGKERAREQSQASSQKAREVGLSPAMISKKAPDEYLKEKTNLFGEGSQHLKFGRYGEETYNQPRGRINAHGTIIDYIIYRNSAMGLNVAKFVNWVHRTQASME